MDINKIKREAMLAAEKSVVNGLREKGLAPNIEADLANQEIERLKKENKDLRLTVNMLDVHKVREMKSLLEKYEEWEAMMIADNAMWWPYAEKDAMSGKTYDMMLELQAKRNELLGR